MYKKLLICAVFVLLAVCLNAQANGYIVKLNGDTIKGEIRMTSKAGYKSPAYFKLKTPEEEKIKFVGDEITYMKYGKNEYCLRKLFPEKSKKKERMGLFGIVKNECGYLILRRSYEKSSTSGTGATSMYSESYYHIYKGDKYICELDKKNYKQLISKYFSCDEKWVREVQHNKKLKFHKLFIEFIEEEEEITKQGIKLF